MTRYLLAVLALCACAERAPGPGDPAALRAGVDSAADRLLAALRGDAADSLLALMADDVVLMPPDEPVLKGKSAVRAWYDGLLTQLRTRSLAITDREVLLGGEWATEIAAFEWTLVPVAGGAPVTERGSYVQVWRREPDGRWLFAREAWNSSTPPVAAQTATCVPVAERAGREVGCFITAREELGTLPRDSAFYWHIDAFPSRAAAEAARARRSTVVRSLGRDWLFTIAEAAWRPGTGRRVASAGPLPLIEAERFAAVYMEGVFRPGMRSPVHRHPGVEVWYTLEGEQCLETPQGKLVQRAGDAGVMVPAGIPMMLTGTGQGVRRSLVLILQDSAQPRSMLATDWKPTGVCDPKP